MSQPNPGEKKTRGGRFGDRFRRSWARSSSSVVSNTTTGASSSIAPASETARSQQQRGSNSTQQLLGLIPIITTPEPLGGPRMGLVVPAPFLVAGNTAPPLLRPATPVPPAGTLSDKSEVGSLWARALDGLSAKDRNTLETNETGSNLDIEELLDEIRAKREECLKNQWEFEFRGRSVNLRYQADKIISWLAKFKEVGDIAIQQDPSHAALPWAGIRFLLQVGMASFLASNANHSTDVYSRARPDGVPPHGSRENDEYDQPMQNIRDSLPRWHPIQANGRPNQAGIRATECGIDLFVHGGAALPCKGLPGVRQKRVSQSATSHLQSRNI